MLALRFGKVYLHSRIIFMRKVGEIFAHPRSVRIFGVERKIDLYPAVALAVPLAVKLQRFRNAVIGCGIGIFVERNDRTGYVQLYARIKRRARGIGTRKIHIREGDRAAREKSLTSSGVRRSSAGSIASSSQRFSGRSPPRPRNSVIALWQ